MKTFGHILKGLRQESNLTIEELALELNKKYGTKLSKSSISRWENSGADPKLEFVRILVDFFNVDSSIFMQNQENNKRSLLSQINKTTSKLIEPRQIKVLKFATHQLQQQEESNVASLEEYKNRKRAPFPAYGSTGAGIGEELYDDILSEEVYFYEDEIPDTADFCIFVNGDSMEPALRQGTYCFIQNIQQLKDGLVALVIYDGTVLIKKIALNEDEIRLVSLNPKYEDITVKNHQQFKLVGKVVQ